MGSMYVSSDTPVGKLTPVTDAQPVGKLTVVGQEQPKGKLTVVEDAGSVDWGFIAEREGNKRDVYVPTKGDKVLGTSGPTVGMGIDLGAWSGDKLRELGVSEELVNKLSPYGGKKKQEALDFVKANPLSLSKEETDELNSKVKSSILDEIKTQFNKESKTKFEALPSGKQTAVASVFFQYGMNKEKSTWPKNYWSQVTTGDWKGAKANLNNFQDAYDSRRKAEAKLF